MRELISVAFLVGSVFFLALSLGARSLFVSRGTIRLMVLLSFLFVLGYPYLATFIDYPQVILVLVLAIFASALAISKFETDAGKKSTGNQPIKEVLAPGRPALEKSPALIVPPVNPAVPAAPGNSDETRTGNEEAVARPAPGPPPEEKEVDADLLKEYLREGFKLKRDGQLAKAAKLFLEVYRLTNSRNLRISLLIEVSKIYRETGQTAQADAILKLLAQKRNSAVNLPPEESKIKVH